MAPAPLDPDSLMSSPRAVRVRRVAGLARRQARVKHRRFLVEGPQGVREAVRCAAEHVHDVYLTPETAERHGEILAEAEAAGLHTHMAAPEVVGAMSTDAQGVIAVVGTGALAGGAGLADVLTGAHLVAVLTQTQDPGNAGTIIRTADAAGADAVVLVRGGVDPTGPKVVRATAGSLFHLPVLAGEGLEAVVEALRSAGLQLLAADGRGRTDLFDADGLLAAPTAWMLGNEARGLAPGVVSRADTVVSIPLYGRAESLNVASAAALCLYASARAQR